MRFCHAMLCLFYAILNQFVHGFYVFLVSEGAVAEND